MKKILFIAVLVFSLNGEAQSNDINNNSCQMTKIPAQKAVVYQVFTRLFGNTTTTNTPWGTIEENGVGKFNDFTDKA